LFQVLFFYAGVLIRRVFLKISKNEGVSQDS